MFASNRSMDSLGAGITSLLRPQNPSSSSSYSHIPPSSSTFARNPPNSSSNQCSAFDRTSFGSFSTAVDQVPSIGVNPTTNNNLSASPPNPRPADPEPSVTQTRLNESQSESVTATPVIGGDTLADVPANKKPAISRPSEEEEVVLHLQSETSGCPSPSMSFYSAVPYTEAKQSFTNTEEASDRASSVGKSIESSEVSNSCDLTEFRKTASHYRASTGSDLSDESSTSSMSSSAMYKPHRANNDVRSEAVRAVRSRDGALGLNHFRVLTKVGGGDIGKVYLSELTGTRTYFAMKVMDKGDLESRKKLVRAQTEREILQALDHPFLPTLYTHFDTERFSCLVMEFCPGGDLHAMRQRRPGKYFSEHAARFYVAEVLLALEYLHMLGIVYRDLKPENVLVREDGHIMLSDFDLSLRCAVSPTIIRSSNSTPLDPKNSSSYCIEPACMIQPDCMTPACFSPRFFSPKSKKSKKKRLKAKAEIHQQVTLLPELVAEPTSARSMSFVGTHEYLAPEIIKGEGHGSAVDWWTFGIFLYELLFGRTPFCGPDNRSTLFNVVGQPLRFPETPAVSFAARDLIRGLLVKEPQHRLAYRRGATEIKQHPFFQSVNWALIRCATPPQVPQPFAYDLAAAKAAALPPSSGSNGMTTTTSKQPEQTTVQDMKPSGNYYEIDFF